MTGWLAFIFVVGAVVALVLLLSFAGGGRSHGDRPPDGTPFDPPPPPG